MNRSLPHRSRVILVLACCGALTALVGWGVAGYFSSNAEPRARVQLSTYQAVLAISPVASNGQCAAVVADGILFSLQVSPHSIAIVGRSQITNGRIAAASFSADGNVVATMADDGRELTVHRQDHSQVVVGTNARTIAMSLAGGGESLFFGDTEGVVWSAPTTNPTAIRLFKTNAAVDTVVTFGASLICAADVDGAIVVFDRVVGAKVNQVSIQPAGTIRALAWVSQNDILIGTGDGRLLRWDRMSGGQPRLIVCKQATIECVSASLHTQRAIVGLRRNHKALWQWESDQAALVIDLQANREIALLETDGGVWSVAGDGRDLLTGDASGQVCTWVVE